MAVRSFEFARKMKDGKVVTDSVGEVKAYPEAQLPEYQTKYSAGADFFCAEEVIVPSIWKGVLNLLAGMITGRGQADLEDTFKPTLVHTGIKASMYDDEALKLYNRSSNPGKRGLILANGVGLCDADYPNNPDNDGEIMFAFYNIKPWDTIIKVGDRIGQGVFEKVLRPETGLRIKGSERSGGFGSTDK